MTDRINRLVVVLEHDIRTDDCEPLINAIRQMRGVLKVKENVATPDAYMAEERAKSALTKKIWEALK